MVMSTRMAARAHVDLDGVSRDAGMQPESENEFVLSERDRIWIEQNRALFEFWNDHVERTGFRSSRSLRLHPRFEVRGAKGLMATHAMAVPRKQRRHRRLQTAAAGRAGARCHRLPASGPGAPGRKKKAAHRAAFIHVWEQLRRASCGGGRRSLPGQGRRASSRRSALPARRRSSRSAASGRRNNPPWSARSSSCRWARRRCCRRC